MELVMTKKKLLKVILVLCLLALIIIIKKNADTSVSGFSSNSIVKVESGVGTSTGFIYNSDYVITCCHSIDESNYVVITNNGKNYDGEIIAKDIYHDLALIEANGLDSKAIEIGDAKTGETVYVLNTENNKLIELEVVEVGYQVENNITYDGSDYTYNLEVTKLKGDLKEGFSGSPVFNKDGEVVGVITMKDDYVYAIPIDSVNDLFNIGDLL